MLRYPCTWNQRVIYANTINATSTNNPEIYTFGYIFALNKHVKFAINYMV